MSISDVHDRGYVYVDSQFVGMVSREREMYDLAVSALPNQTITIIVESQGRVCFGSEINDFKVKKKKKKSTSKFEMFCSNKNCFLNIRDLDC